MRLTKEHLEALATDKGGYTKATLTALNVKWDGVHHSGLKGWRKALLNASVTDEQYRAALEGRTVYSNQNAYASNYNAHGDKLP